MSSSRCFYKRLGEEEWHEGDAPPEFIATGEQQPPNPYDADLKKLRAANAMPALTFEDQYKAARLCELDAEGARLAAHIEATPFPRLSAAEAADLATYAPPDSYKAGLDKMRSEGR